jgi:hypothetical protein
MNLLVPQNAGKFFLSGCTIGGLSREVLSFMKLVIYEAEHAFV